MSKKNLSTLIQLIIFLSLGIGLIVWRYNAISAAEKAEMFAALASIRWIWLIPVILVGYLSHHFRALRWKLLLEPLNIYPGTRNTVFAVLTGYLANLLVPRLGEVAKCTVLAKYESVPADRLVGTIIAERAFDMVCLVGILIATLLLQYDILYPFAQQLYLSVFTDESGAFIWRRIVIGLLIVLALLLLFIFITKKLRGSKTGKIFQGIAAGLKSIAQVRQKARFMLYTALIWGLYTFLIIIGFWALPDMAGIPTLAALSILTFGSVGMIATPGGIGAYPVIVAQVLLLYGISEGLGLAFGWVSWAAQTVVVIILGLSSLILLPIYNRKKNAEKGKYPGQNP